jgi:hypothetical protein
MYDMVLAVWSRLRAVDGDERGTTTLEYVMFVALIVATVVFAASLGASLTGTEVA